MEFKYGICCTLFIKFTVKSLMKLPDEAPPAPVRGSSSGFPAETRLGAQSSAPLVSSSCAATGAGETLERKSEAAQKR